MPGTHAPRMVGLDGKSIEIVFRPLRKGNARGIIDPPETLNRKIVVDSRLRRVERLEVLVHEFLHAIAWWLDEAYVTKWAADIARELWALGLRWKDEDE